MFSMSEISELFWNATIEEMKQGYVYQELDEVYICLACGDRFEKGIVYTQEGVFYEAEKFTRVHIDDNHMSMFDYLISLDKKITGLTDLQRNLIEMFYEGLNDNEIGSTSTIRNHRFTLREKMKQAKVFLAIMESVAEKSKNPSKLVPIHRRATMIDQRYDITETENTKILQDYFKMGLEGPLMQFPRKEKKKIIILRHLIKMFDSSKEYTEKEVNEVLKVVFADFVTLRRYLIEYGFMDRHEDGSKYWVKL
jgi:hypothetical protein